MSVHAKTPKGGWGHQASEVGRNKKKRETSESDHKDIPYSSKRKSTEFVTGWTGGQEIKIDDERLGDKLHGLFADVEIDSVDIINDIRKVD